LENVPDLVAWNDGAVLVGFREGLREEGYWTDARILDSRHYGVPQYRQRLFIVGLLDTEDFAWPERAAPATLRDAIGDLPPVPGGQRLETVAYSAETQSELAQRLRRGVASDEVAVIHDHITRDVREDDAEAYRMLKPGGVYTDLPERLRRYRSDIFTDKYKRLEWHLPSRSITAHLAKDGYWYIHPAQDRTLSIREAARIQTFPDWFRFSGHPTTRFRQIGNAVPPLLGEALGRSLHRSLAAGERRVPEQTVTAVRFRHDLLAWHADHSQGHPWRPRGDPWQVLIGELVLQRATSKDAVRVWARLIEVAPTPATLHENAAKARTALLGLGLRRRADLLIKLAAVIVRDCGGVVPENPEDLARLPGVGDYLVNAVLCFGFGRRAILLDANTERLQTRLNGLHNQARWQLRLDLYDLASREGPDREFNHALIDLGTILCQPSSPKCAECPVARYCSSRQTTLDLFTNQPQRGTT
jgi:DNA (cytosine-5)-methyltransferase 1